MTSWTKEFTSAVMFLDDLDNFSKTYTSLMLITRNMCEECEGDDRERTLRDFRVILTKMGLRIQGVIDGMGEDEDE